MLQTIRDKAQGWIAWVIVIFISIPFALWGINEYLGVGGEPIAVEVEGTEITQQQLDVNVERFRSQLRQLFGGKVPESYTDEVIRKQVMDRLINEQAMSVYVTRSGLRAGDQMVSEEIAGYASFQRDGVFDKDTYRRALVQQRQTPASFEEQVRRGLSVDVLRDAVTDSAFVSDAELDAYIELKDQLRTISYVTVKQPEGDAGQLVSDDEVRAYYEANQAAFIRPERVKIEYLELSRPAMAATIDIAPEEIQTYYDDHSAAYTAEEKRGMRHILFPVNNSVTDEEAKASAEAVLDELKAGGDFATLAKTHSGDPGSASAGGDLGLVSRGVMVKPFEDAAFALEQDAISDLVRTRFGYHIIQVTGIEGGQRRPFEEVSDEIRQQLQNDKAETLFYDYAEQLADLTYDSPDLLEPAADALGLEIRRSEWLPREGSDDRLATAKVMAAVFSDDVREQGFNSPVIELDAETLVVVRLAEYEDSATRPFEEVADVIREQLESDARSDIAAKHADDLMRRLQAGESIAALADAEGLEVVSDMEVSRTSANVPSAIIDSVFRLFTGEGKATFTTTALASGDYAVIELTSVKPGDVTALDEQQREALKATMSSSRGSNALSAYTEWLRDSSDVTIMSR